MRLRVHSGQAMLETVFAALFVTLLFLGMFSLSERLTAKILVQHAAMRVSRARTVGLNDFMCVKAARLSMLPVAGRRIRPADDGFTVEMERARFENYMLAPTPGIAAAVLDYEGWYRLGVKPGDGRDSTVTYSNLTGRAGIRSNYTLYMNDEGR